MAAPSYSGILAHSIACTQDTCTKTKTEIDFLVGVAYALTPPISNVYIGGWGGESARDPNREIDFGFVFVHVSCVRAKLCARIRL